jgi:hypothetical protein
MTKRHIDLGEALKNPDLDLITDFLANELDPEQVAEVRRRLEEDSAFRDFAAPIVAAWNVKPLWQREPIARAEVEKSWAKFTKKAGFKHQRRRRRWLWWTLGIALVLLLPVFAILGWGLYMSREFSQVQARGRTVIAADPPVFDSARLMTLPNGVKFAVDSGADVRMLSQSAGVAYSRVHLSGKAWFFIYPDSAKGTIAGQGLEIETPAGQVITNFAAIEVHARGDTTSVVVFGRPRDLPGLHGLVPMVLLMQPTSGVMPKRVVLTQGDNAEMIRPAAPVTRPSDSSP